MNNSGKDRIQGRRVVQTMIVSAFFLGSCVLAKEFDGTIQLVSQVIAIISSEILFILYILIFVDEQVRL
jgi:hypothetical protein